MSRPRADPDRPKKCNRCEKMLPRGCFDANPDRHDGLFDGCRECRAKLLPVGTRRDPEEVHPERLPALMAEVEERLAIVRAAKTAKAQRGEPTPGLSLDVLTMSELNAILPRGRLPGRRFGT